MKICKSSSSFWCTGNLTQMVAPWIRSLYPPYSFSISFEAEVFSLFHNSLKYRQPQRSPPASNNQNSWEGLRFIKVIIFTQRIGNWRGLPRLPVSLLYCLHRRWSYFLWSGSFLWSEKLSRKYFCLAFLQQQTRGQYRDCTYSYAGNWEVYVVLIKMLTQSI